MEKRRILHEFLRLLPIVCSIALTVWEVKLYYDFKHGRDSFDHVIAVGRAGMGAEAFVDFIVFLVAITALSIHIRIARKQSLNLIPVWICVVIRPVLLILALYFALDLLPS
ncbi:hypothetical protein [Paludisphaera borealis]|uniref:DUF5658 domain-containing protein n=1 Tax=Paludisphaera borealis TaxID=1387353 RepID=A0A1U7CP11_9BACT|nr:hypothetical protein [Paludisphaera borealis]APW60648.1 hypothetical protein BSF38_02132 [Paludisphaera borealis]